MYFISKLRNLKYLKLYSSYSTSVIKNHDPKNELEIQSSIIIKPFSKEILLNRFNLNILEFPEVENNECVDKTKIAALGIEKLLSTNEKRDRDTILTHLSSTGIMGLSIPGHVIGGRFTWMMVSRLIESLSLDVEYTMTSFLPHTLICQTLLYAGNDDQKERYMKDFSIGRLKGCVAINEGNSDMVNSESITATAREQEHSKCWIINGCKSQVFNYVGSDMIMVWAKTITGEIAPFIVDSKAEGISESRDRVDSDRLCSELTFVNVTVPKENMLSSQLGTELPRYLSAIGNIGTSAMCSALIKSMIQQVNDFVCHRHVFGRALSQFEVTQDHIVTLTSASYSVESVAYLTAGMLDNKQHGDLFIESLLAKSHSLESLRKAVDMCLRIMGSNCLTDSYFKKIYEDANKLLRNQVLPSLSRQSLAKESLEYAFEQIKTKKFNLYEKVAETIGNYKIQALLPGNIIVNSFKYNLHQRLGHLADNVYGEYRQFSTILKTMSDGSECDGDDFCLHSVAGVLVDSYVMMAVLGRASRSICSGIRNHDHEVRLAERICESLTGKIKGNVAALKGYPGNVNEWNLLSRAVKSNETDVVVRKRLS